MFIGSRKLLWTLAAIASTASAAPQVNVLYDSTKDHAKVGETNAAPISGWISLSNKGEVAAQTHVPNGPSILMTFKDGQPEVALRSDKGINNFIFTENHESLVKAEGVVFVDASGQSRTLSADSIEMSSLHDFNRNRQFLFGVYDSEDALLEELRLSSVEHPESSAFLVKTLDADGLNGSPFINLGHARINNNGRIVFMGKEGVSTDRLELNWGNSADIYTVDAEGNWSQVKRTDSLNIIPYRPFWLSDNDLVVYEAEDKSKSYRYFVTSLDGSGHTWQIGLRDNLSQVNVLDVSVSGRVLFSAMNAAGAFGFYVTQNNEPAQLILDTTETLPIDGKLFLVNPRNAIFGSLNDQGEVVMNLPLLHASDKSSYGDIMVRLKI